MKNLVLLLPARRAQIIIASCKGNLKTNKENTLVLITVVLLKVISKIAFTEKVYQIELQDEKSSNRMPKLETIVLFDFNLNLAEKKTLDFILK